MAKKNPDLDYLAYLGFCVGIHGEGVIRERPFLYIFSERRLEIGDLSSSEVKIPAYRVYDLSIRPDRRVLEKWLAGD